MTDITRRKVDAELMKFREALDELKGERTPDVLDRFRANPKSYYAVCFLFVIAIESLVDIGQYVLTNRKKRAESQRDVIRLLAQERVLPPDLAERLLDVLRFRNILIHVYPNLDDAKVASYLQHNLDDFDAFLAAVNRALGDAKG